MRLEVTPAQPGDTVPIGRCRFDHQDEAVIGPDGTRVDMRPQTARVLRKLLANRGEVVSRDQILADVWPDTHVTEDSVTQCIREIRAALGDEGHRLLRTLPKRGYLLERDDPALPRPSVARRFRAPAVLLLGLMAAAGVVATLMWNKEFVEAGRPHVVVRPFEDIYQTDMWSRVGAGLANELSAALARNAWLDVRQSGARSDDDQGSDGYLLEGTISAGSGAVRLTAKLTDEDTGEILWSDVWNGAEEEVFDMQSSLLEKVEATVAPAWTGVIPRERLARIDGLTRDVGAYDLYLRAIEQKHLFTPAALARSQRYLEQSLALDGDFARAWTALAIAHLLQMEHASSRSDFEEHLSRRIDATRRAMELAPNDPETLIQSTFLLGRDHDHVAAEAALRRAVALGWNNPDILAQAAWGGSRRVPVGEDAVQWAKRALELNQTPPPWYFAGLATAAFHAGDYELAAEAYAKAPPVTEVLYRRAATEAHLGHLEAAQGLLSQSLTGLPEGMTVRELEAADGSTYPPYVEQLGSLLEKIGDA